VDNVYEVVLLMDHEKEDVWQNYGIQHKEHGVIEARTRDLVAARAAMHHLETMLKTEPWLKIETAYASDANGDMSLGFTQREVYDS